MCLVRPFFHLKDHYLNETLPFENTLNLFDYQTTLPKKSFSSLRKIIRGHWWSPLHKIKLTSPKRPLSKWNTPIWKHTEFVWLSNYTPQKIFLLASKNNKGSLMISTSQNKVLPTFLKCITKRRGTFIGQCMFLNNIYCHSLVPTLCPYFKYTFY